MKSRQTVLALVASATLLAACGDGLDIPRVPTRLVYDGTTGDIPLPNDVLFADNPTALNLDATLNFPPASDAAQQPLFDALNSLDGFSTTAPLSFHFSRGVDPTTVVGGMTVRLFEVDALVDPQTGLKLGTPVSDVIAELAVGVDYAVAPAPSDPTGATWSVLPLRPLKPTTIYMLVVTNGIADTEGFAVEPGSSYALAKANTAYPPGHPALGLQALVSAMELAASSDVDVAPAIPAAEIVMSLSFTTQSTFDVLATTAQVNLGLEGLVLAGICAAAPDMGHSACAAGPANTVPSAALGAFVGDTASLWPAATGLADVYSASLTLPYYSTSAPNAGGGLVQDVGPLGGRWAARFSFLEGTLVDPMELEKNATRYNPLPLETTAETVPVVITLPNGTSGQVQPATGWPVVIFQHGIGRDRSDVVRIADELAGAGFAAVAIDMPLHGVTDAGSPLHVGYADGGVRERLFGLDLVTQDGAGNVTDAAPDGTVDTSGAHFINLSSLQTLRDNLRQAVTDLFAVVKLIGDNMDVDGSAVIVADDFDPTQIHFVGHSLGGIVGTIFTAVDAAGPAPVLSSATLNATGGGLPRMLEASPGFGPGLIAGLAAGGLVQGTPEFDAFMFAAQTLVDSGDPVNFCVGLNGGPTPILMQEIVGGGAGGGVADQVVPNNVPSAPLSGTDPMIALMGLTQISAVGTTPSTAALVRFSEGTHNSLRDPDPELDMDAENQLAFTEMSAEIAAWVASISTIPAVTISTGSVIAP